MVVKGVKCTYIFVFAKSSITIVNAAAIEKRAISTQVQTCIDDMVYTAAQLDVVTNLVSAG